MSSRSNKGKKGNKSEEKSEEEKVGKQEGEHSVDKKNQPKEKKEENQEKSLYKFILSDYAKKVLSDDSFSNLNHYFKHSKFDDNAWLLADGNLKSYSLLNNHSIDEQLSLQKEINDLRTKLRQTFNDLNQVTSDKDAKIEELDIIIEELQSKEKLNHVLSRICEQARQKLLNDKSFRAFFDDGKNCETVVVSIDIRRSTELMLKARTPQLFSRFITDLSQKLSEVILSNFGVFDKFTGDGILAFFPKFYSGEFAIIRALKAADECHRVFEEHYRNSRECFNVFIKDVGLGIGVDYGNVTLVNTRNELTVVGIPVVYACRMSGAKAGDTLLNQPAKEEIVRLCDNYIKVSETEINIKNEGTALAYKVELHIGAFDAPEPEWLKPKEATNTKG
ncbi:MAG: adenylate/guanylate cyclase domain-containing protein [Flavobacteriales bacterium]|nr:adenylate/guanylate cyclase domain-containing protein [Flavobacteriales bacterium]